MQPGAEEAHRERRQRARAALVHQLSGDLHVEVGQRELEAALREEGPGALHVAPDPGHVAGSAQQRLEPPRDLVEGERAGTAGQVDRALGVERHREAHRLVRQRARLADHREQRDAGKLRERRDERIEGSGVLDDFDADVRAARRARRTVERIEQAREAQALEERAQLLAVGLDAARVLELEGQRHVGAQGREALREARRLGVLAQRVARACAGHLFDVVEQALEVPPLADQLRRPLGTDPLHAGDVVARVADQRAQVADPLRRHAKALLHLGGAEARVLYPVEQGHPLAHELHQVLVGGDDRDLRVRRRALDEGRDHVVGLDVLHLEDRDPVRLDQLAHDRDLRREILGLGLAARLVPGEEAMSEGLAARVEDHDQDVGLLVAQHLAEHVDEAVGGVRGRAVGRAQSGDREEGAVEGVGAVDEDDLGRHVIDPDSPTA